jgi:dihydroorotate dehydrogenase (NAD+) catalytic subunit
MAASGTFGYGLEFADKMDISAIGGFVTKGLSLKPRAGNPMPRICETVAGMLNSIGLENVGVEAFEKEKLPGLRKSGATVIANFFGETDSEYVEAARRLGSMDGVHALEMNVSCPNVDRGGIEFGSDPALLGRLTESVRKVVKIPLIVKLSPNVTDIRIFAKAAEDGGADAISAINTLKGMSVDVQNRRSKLNREFGGLSGPAIKPVALYMARECALAVKIPVIGVGGIASLNDVLEFLIVGAAAVQIGTMNFVEPGISQSLADELADYCKKEGIKKIGEISGSLKKIGKNRKTK